MVEDDALYMVGLALAENRIIIRNTDYKDQALIAIKILKTLCHADSVLFEEVQVLERGARYTFWPRQIRAVLAKKRKQRNEPAA